MMCASPASLGGASDRGVSEDRLYFRQLLAGRDFARKDPVARQMVNLVYLIGDRESGEALAVDLAYAPQEVLDILEADGMLLGGVLATHHHPDHVGGDLFGHWIVGISELLDQIDVPIHANRHEIAWIGETNGDRSLEPRRPRGGRRREGGRGRGAASAHPGAYAWQPVLPGRRLPRFR